MDYIQYGHASGSPFCPWSVLLWYFTTSLLQSVFILLWFLNFKQLLFMFNIIVRAYAVPSTVHVVWTDTAQYTTMKVVELYIYSVLFIVNFRNLALFGVNWVFKWRSLHYSHPTLPLMHTWSLFRPRESLAICSICCAISLATFTIELFSSSHLSVSSCSSWAASWNKTAANRWEKCYGVLLAKVEDRKSA